MTKAEKELRIANRVTEAMLEKARKMFPGCVAYVNPDSAGQIIVHNPAAEINITVKDPECPHERTYTSFPSLVLVCKDCGEEL